MTKLLSLVLAGVPLLATAQLPFPMEYVDEVGHMGWQDQRVSVDLGLATVYHECEGCEANTASDQLRFEGKDDSGKLWRLWIPRVGGFGGTEAWTADFDRNGRQDLLISQYFLQNGRCIDGFDLVFLLFDRSGRPHASKAGTHLFSGFQVPPAIFTDINRDGRAELILNDCSYSDPPRFGEDRWISGIYEARDNNWVALRNTSEEPYLSELQEKRRGPDPDFIKWLTLEQNNWPNSPEHVGRTGLPRIEVSQEQ